LFRPQDFGAATRRFRAQSSTRFLAAALIQAQRYVIMSLILRPKQDDVSRFAGAKSSSSRCTFEAESAIVSAAFGFFVG